MSPPPTARLKWLAFFSVVLLMGVGVMLLSRPGPGPRETAVPLSAKQGATLPIADRIAHGAASLGTSGASPNATPAPATAVAAVPPTDSLPASPEGAPTGLRGNVYSLAGFDYPVLKTRAEQANAAGEYTRVLLLQGSADLGRVRVEELVSPTGSRIVSAYILGEVVVIPVEGVTETQLVTLFQSLGATFWRQIYGSTAMMARFQGDDLDLTTHLISTLTSHRDLVAVAESNGLVTGAYRPNDLDFQSQYHLENLAYPETARQADINAVAAWDITRTSPNVIAAVLDSGIDLDHPDLMANVYRDSSEYPANGFNNNATSQIDDYQGWDFVNNDNDPTDDHNHGSHVSGIMGAVGDDETGRAGVTWSVRILPVKILNASNAGTGDNLASGIGYANACRAKVLNLSLQNYGYYYITDNALTASQNGGRLVVVAAGNVSTNNDNTPNYPSSYLQSNIIAVANTTSTDTLNPGSCYGLTSVDIGAPGTSILNANRTGGSASLTGTSMAAPQVAGVACLLLGLFPNATVQDLKGWILNSTDPLPALSGKCVTGGRLNARAALQAAITQSGVAPAFTFQPSAPSGYAGDNVRLNVIATGSPAPRFQWQISKNGGATWSNLESIPPYAGATSASLEITTLSLGMNGHRFRCVADNWTATPATTGSATLTVQNVSLPRVATPTFFPLGGNELGTQVVNLACATQGSQIRYTLDGSDPDQSSTLYTSSFVVDTYKVLKVRAFAPGLFQSSVARTIYNTISPTAKTPYLRIWGTAGLTTLPTTLQIPTTVELGQAHIVTQTWNNRLTAWGTNTSSCVSATPTAYMKLMSIGQYFGVASLESTNQVFAWGSNDSFQTQVPPNLFAVALSAGQRHALAVRADGTVASWGYDSNNLVTEAQTWTGITAVSGGDAHSVGLKVDGTVVVSGTNLHGEKNVPVGLANVTAIAAGRQQTLALREDGTVVAWGGNDAGCATVPAGLTDVVEIAAGGDHSAALRRDGSIVYFGYNGYSSAVKIPRELKGYAHISAGPSNFAAVRHTILPRITKQPMAQTVLANQPFVLRVQASTALSYQWFRGPKGDTRDPVDDAFLPTLRVAGGRPSTTQYWVRVENAISTVDSLAVTVTVAVPPGVSQQPASQMQLVGGSATFIVQPTGTGPFTYQWMKGAQTIPGATTNTLTLNNLTPGSAGSYYLVITTPYGTLPSESATLSVGNLPAPLAAPSLSAGTFSALFQGTPGFTYTMEGTDFLGGWGKIGNFTAPTTDQGSGVGAFLFQDAVGTTNARYYRAVFPAY